MWVRKKQNLHHFFRKNRVTVDIQVRRIAVVIVIDFILFVMDFLIIDGCDG